MLSLARSPEQVQLSRTVRAFLAGSSPMVVVRERMESVTGHLPTVWAEMADRLGLQGLAIPARHGGAAGSWDDLAIVFEEMGRALAGDPYLATIGMAATALAASGDEEAQARHLPGLASGDEIATLAVAEHGRSWDEHEVSTLAQARNGRYELTGRKAFVVDGHLASVLVVAARTDVGVDLFTLDGDAPGLSCEVHGTFDPTRRLSTLHLQDVPATRLVGDTDPQRVLSDVMARAATALAAEQAGGADAVLDAAVEHAKAREQFGRPIGSYQAVKHRCADMLVEVEAAAAAARVAAAAAAEDDPELPQLASLAKAVCSDAYVYVTGAATQIHGAIAFTWEHDLHLHLKRAASSAQLLGSATLHRERVLQELGI